MSWIDYLADPLLAEFAALEAGGGARVLVRRGREEELPVLLHTLGASGGPVVLGGRAAHPVVAMSDGELAVVRRYRRGGLMRHVNRDRYLRGHRAFDEVRATERARAGGVRTLEVVAGIEVPQRFGYRALLATVLLPGARDLAEFLAAEPSQAARSAALREAGRQVGRMHAAGVAHPDLNLRNLLVTGREAPEVWIIDFDRARTWRGAVPADRRERDWKRLLRSARKLRAPVGAAEWRLLTEGYLSVPIDVLP